MQKLDMYHLVLVHHMENENQDLLYQELVESFENKEHLSKELELLHE
jgi:hypothetical protein